MADADELTARITTIADEAFGPFPVQSADESLTQIERGIFRLRRDAEDHMRVGLNSLMALGEARADAAAVRAYAARLEAALERSHACATVREDGECDGCFISEALATCPSEAP